MVVIPHPQRSQPWHFPAARSSPCSHHLFPRKDALPRHRGPRRSCGQHLGPKETHENPCSIHENQCETHENPRKPMEIHESLMRPHKIPCLLIQDGTMMQTCKMEIFFAQQNKIQSTHPMAHQKPSQRVWCTQP